MSSTLLRQGFSEFLERDDLSEILAKISELKTPEEVVDALKDFGVDMSTCSMPEAVSVFRDALNSISEDELMNTQGGEKKIGLAIVAAAVGTGAAVAGGIGAGGIAAAGILLS